MMRVARALDVVLEKKSLREEWVDADVNLSFAAPRWRKLVHRSHGDGSPTNPTAATRNLRAFGHGGETVGRRSMRAGCAGSDR